MILLLLATKVFYETSRIVQITKHNKEYRVAFDKDLLFFFKSDLVR